jgi:hypothetical protein
MARKYGWRPYGAAPVGRPIVRAAVRGPGHPGKFVALVSAHPAETATVIERLGGFVPSKTTSGGVRVDAIDSAEFRRRNVIADNDAHRFADTFRQCRRRRRRRQCVMASFAEVTR